MKTNEVLKGKNVLLILLGVLFISLAFQQVMNTDIFFHIKCGNDMLRTGRIIDKNVYSFAADNYEFSNHSWVSKVVFAVTYNIAGIYGINILMALLLALVFARIFMFLGRTKYFSYYYFLVVIGIILAAPRFQARPQLFSFLFFAVYLQLLLAYVNNKNRKLLIAIVPLQYIWNNMHAYSIMGLFLVGCFVIDEIVRSLVRKRIRKQKTDLLRMFFEKGTLSLISVFLLQIVTYLVLYRFDLFIKMYLQLFGDYRQFCFSNIEEFLPVGFKPLLLLILIFIGITAPVLCRVRKSGDYARCIITAALLVLTLKVSRNISYLVIAVLIFVGNELRSTRNKGKFLDHIKQLETKNGLVNGALILTSCLLIFSQLTLVHMQVTGFGVHKFAVPVALGDFLEKNEIKGNGYNEFAEGSYLIFRAPPKKKVLIHNQVEAYPPRVLDEYMQCYQNKNMMTRLINKHRMTHAIINFRQRSRHLLQWFSESDLWRLVYFDGLYCVFVKKNAENKALIDQYYIADDPASVNDERVRSVFATIRKPTMIETAWFAFSGYSQVGYTRGETTALSSYRKALGFFGLKYFNKTEAELFNALEAAPWNTEIMQMLLKLYGTTKQTDRIMLLDQASKERLPSDQSLSFMCAQALIGVGKGTESTAILDELEKKSFSPYLIDKARGDLFLYEGKFADAVTFYEKAARDPKANDLIYSDIGKVYLLMGELEKARAVLEKYLAKHRENVEDLLVLADVYRGLGMKEAERSSYERVLEFDVFNEKARAFLRRKE
jgi:tetratricopeptide (TPR) repeat protein